jgi:hypothetical protein
MRALVTDFGSSRKLRPRSPRVIYSAFTGVTTAAPAIGGVTVQQMARPDGIHASLLTSVETAHGTLTKAVGTLLWMVRSSPRRLT